MDPQQPPTVPEPAPRRWRWQWSLRTLLLLTAAIAAWTAYVQVGRESEVLRSEIDSMEKVARKLTVDDPGQFAVVERPQVWRNDERWHVYLPPGGTYRLKLATYGIDLENFPEPKWEATLQPGRHEIASQLDIETSRMTMLFDGQQVIEAAEGAGWNASAWSGHGGYYERSQQMPVSKPLLLIRRRFMTPAVTGGSTWPPSGPTPGMLLWIERDPDGPAPSQPAPGK
jgi:hypothetical protein